MISNDIIEDFTNRLKKEKVEYFIFLAKKPNKSQKSKNPDIDINIAHYQSLDQQRLVILYYCLSKMMSTGSFDPNVPWDGLNEDESEDIEGSENWDK